MNNKKNLKEEYVSFMGSWMSGALVGHALGLIIGKVMVYGAWLWFMYHCLQSCTGK